MPLRTLDSLEQVRALGADILDEHRTTPIVAVTTRFRESRPPVDAEALARACSPLTVYVIRTGELTWELTAVLPAQFEVYGGAGRIWWPGLRPTDNPHKHPLVFCWSDDEAPKTLERLLGELRSRGFAGPLPAVPTATPSQRRSSTPPPIAPPAPRPESPPAPSQPRPTRPGHRRQVGPGRSPAIEVGQILEGVVREAQPGGADITLGAGTRGWLVVRPRMAPLTVGDRVWVRVAAVDPDSGYLSLEPPPRDSTPKQLSPQRASIVPPSAPPGSQAAAAISQPDVDAVAAPTASMVASVEADDAPTRTLESPSSAASAIAARDLDATVRALENRLRLAESDARQLQRQLEDAERDKLNAIQEMRRQRERANQTQRELRSERDRAEDLERRLHGLDQHVEPTDQFRHEVEVARARLVGDPAASSADMAVRFVLGPEFLTSVDNIQGVRRSKVVEVVAKLLYSPPGRQGRPQEHPLRTSEAGGSPQRTRSDGAKAFRVELQQSTPAARRLHYWRLPDGSIELANVVYHDDMTIT